MAITIHNTPQDYTPSDNKVVWTFSSDQTAQTNFTYLVKIFINNVEVDEATVYPLSGINAYFDASDIASRYCSIPALTDDLVIDAQNYCQVKISITERYGDPVADGTTTTGTNVITYKAKIKPYAFLDWDYTDYNTLFLTDFPTTLNPKVRAEEQIRLLVLSQDEAFDVIINLRTDEALIATDTYVFADTPELSILNVSPSVIIANTTITSGDFDNSTYYTIEIDGTTVNIPEYRIDLNTDCQYRRAKRLHFLSRIGSIESLDFDLHTREEWTTKSHGVTRNAGYLDGQDYVYNPYRGVAIDYAKTEDGVLKMTSNWLDEDLANFVNSNMYFATALWIEYGETYDLLQRTKILSSGYRQVTKENDLITQEEIEVALIPETSMIV